MAAVFFCTIAGCQFSTSGVPSEETENDAGVGVVPCESWTPAHFEPCEIVAPLGELTLDQAGTYTYDTDFGVLTGPFGSTVEHAKGVLSQTDGDVRLIVVTSLTIGRDAELHATGDLPVIIASFSSIDISGSIDVGSDESSLGAGANAAACVTHAATAGGNNVSGGGGGGGGGFRSSGGRGGRGGNDGILGEGARGDKGGNVDAPTQVRGGCAGGAGGRGQGTTTPGGAGGGAVYLSAAIAIRVRGSILASGAGGLGASIRAGGGGGGSGGMIGLEAPSLVLEASAILTANGGGGGGGSGSIDNGSPTISGGPGIPGLASDQPASGGGSGTVNAGVGGPGGALVDTGGTDGEDNVDDGGGGGGGGEGYVFFASPSVEQDASATVSPTPQ